MATSARPLERNSFPSAEDCAVRYPMRLPHQRRLSPWVKFLPALVILPVLARSAPAVAPDEGAVERLIRKLGDDKFDEREAASHELAQIGLPCVRPLCRAADGDDDSEIRHRAKQAL